jgi:hypothetical protein
MHSRFPDLPWVTSSLGRKYAAAIVSVVIEAFRLEWTHIRPSMSGMSCHSRECS